MLAAGSMRPDREEDPKEDPEEEARTVERGGVVVSMHDVSEEEWQEGGSGAASKTSVGRRGRSGSACGAR
jgi:hypothetical protein